MDELKQMIWYNTTEIESEKAKAFEETTKNKENLKHLLRLLKTAYQERDEARHQLQKLLRNITPSPGPSGLYRSLLLPLRANQMTNRTHHTPELSNYYLAHRPSASNSLLGANPPRDFLAADAAPSSNDPCGVSCTPGFLNSGGANTVSRALEDVIDDLVMGRALPEKGKFLQAVMEAGPLLQTLQWSGPLPRWRNPPPLKLFNIPPVNITGSDPSSRMQAHFSDSSHAVQRFTSPLANLEVPEVFPGTCSASMQNFIASYPGSPSGKHQILSAGASVATNNQTHSSSKRRKLQ